MTTVPSSPVETRLRWLVGAVQDPADLTTTEIADAFNPTGWYDWSPERELEFFRDGRHAASRPLVVEEITAEGTEGAAVLIGADGKRWTVSCRVEPEDPYRIVGARTMPAPPPGTTIRLATPDDGPGLAQLERHAPLRLGHEPITLMTFDHGDDYFAPSRLMEDVTIYVAEVDGQVAGVYCGAVQPVLVDGEMKRLFLEHHVRIDAATARGGVFWALCTFGRDTYARSTDSIAFYVSVDNHPVRKFVEGVPPWSVRPLRALIPCRRGEVRVDADSRRATAADGARLSEIVNDCHEGSALFVPYDGSSLQARLTRDSSQYTWDDVLIRGAAAVGVSRQLLGVTKDRAGAVTASRRALVIDHGFAAGAEDDYRTLLLECAARAGDEGATHLAVFTSESSRTFGVVSNLAEEIEEFDFWAFDVAEPVSIRNGFYVDPIYF